MLTDGRLAITPWANRSTADDAEIRRLSAPPDCPPGLAPERWAGELEDAECLVLCREGQVTGWMLASLDPPQPAVPRTLFVLSAYVRRDLWRSGLLTAAYHHIAHRHAERFGPEALVRFFTVPEYPGMMALTRRRLAPAAVRVDEWLVATKHLAATV